MGSVLTLQEIHGYLASSEEFAVFLNKLEHLGIWLAMAYIISCLISLCGNYKMLTRCFFYLITFALYSVQAFLTSCFQTKISPTILVMIAETNTREAGEFIDSYLLNSDNTPLYFKFLFIIIIIILVEWLYRKYVKVFLMRKKITVSLLLLPVLISSLYSFRLYDNLFETGSLDEFRLNVKQTIPQDPITLSIKSFIMMHKSKYELDLAVENTKNRMASTPFFPDSTKVVLVIGESYIKSHCQLYGYPLDTSPNFVKENNNGNLFFYTDVVTPFNSTSRVIKNMFSSNSIGDNEVWYNFVFIPAIFSSANFDVVFWDNQRDFDTNAEFSFSLNSYLYNPYFNSFYNHTNSKSYQFDGDFVDSFIADNRMTDKQNTFAILHLQGQHINASTRFPHTNEFNVFSPADITRQDVYLNQEKKQHISDYDNATLYNDWVMKKIFDFFRNDNAAIVYLSDHGDEMYDFRDQYGRTHNPIITDSCAKYEFESPFIIWCSDKYKSKHPDIIRNIRESINKPFMSDNLCHVLFYLAGIKTQHYIERRNLLSPAYNCPPRIISDYTDYDKLMKRR